MSRMYRDPIVVGVDVGGVKKGFHAVALREGSVVETYATPSPDEVSEWCLKLNALAVAIDAPCSWSLTGRARPCERALAAAGITAFATPSLTRGQIHPFYGWMLNGAELFRLLASRYRLYEGTDSTSIPVCFETFPHAIACALAGRKLSAKQKCTDRPRLLRDAGLSTASLSNIDYIDAALCALTAHHLLAGTFETYGDAVEGFIVVPE